jgi:hypothetical protein
MSRLVRAALMVMLASCVGAPVGAVDTGNGCVQPNAATDLGSGLSACIVGDLELPIFCEVSESAGSGDPSLIAPCAVEGSYPCWYATADGSCSSGYSITIERMTPAAPNTAVVALCDVVAPSE